MKPLSKILTCLLLLTGPFAYGQMEQYDYRRELKGISGQWHRIVPGDDIFGKIAPNLADIRIFGIAGDGDTVEAPYLMRVLDEQVTEKEVQFRTFNVSQSGQRYYFSFEVPGADPVNEIRLDFRNPNFDWLIKLEGSQDQGEWFTVLDNYRILSVRNELTDFQFTRLSFPESKYRFFRLSVNSEEKPELVATRITQRRVTQGELKDYPIRGMRINEDRQTKETVIDLELQLPVPVSRMKIAVRDEFDYYRPVTVKLLTDSVKTEQGWRYNFRTLQSGTLNSLEENELRFSSTIAQRLRIVVDNQNNQPLHIDAVQVQGCIHELVARFSGSSAGSTAYYLTYGNKEAAKPSYDIGRFEENIPLTLTALELGDEQKIQKAGVSATSPLFENKGWLWAVMAVIMLTLGWFSVRMMRKG